MNSISETKIKVLEMPTYFHLTIVFPWQDGVKEVYSFMPNLSYLRNFEKHHLFDERYLCNPNICIMHPPRKYLDFWDIDFFEFLTSFL